MTRPVGTARRLAIPAVAAFLLVAACGGDDGGIDDDASVDPLAEVDPPTTEDDPAEGDAGGAGVGDAGPDEPGAEAADDEDAAADVPMLPGEPATLLADELHRIDLPEPGTAVVTVAGETFVFDELSLCQFSAIGSTESFTATGSTPGADGATIEFAMSRSVADPEQAGPGLPHERDQLALVVVAETGDRSSTSHVVERETVDAPIEGDGDTTPVILVTDDGTGAATGVAELVPAASSLNDFAPTGPAEFAVTCE